MNYTSLVAQIQNWHEDDSDEFVADIPEIITKSEKRIFTVLPNLPGFRTKVTGNLSIGIATAEKSDNHRVTRQFAITVSGATVFLERRTDSFIQDMYPDDTSTGQPKFFAEDDETTFRFGPVPDAAYGFTVDILREPTGLTASNTTTWLGDHHDDMLLNCCLLEASLYLQDKEQLVTYSKSFSDNVVALGGEVQRIYSNEFGSGV